MKKLLVFVLAVSLMFGGVAFAHNIAVDGKNTDGAANQLISVFNNSGGTLDPGDVVVWQIGSSTGDDDLYITTTTTSDTHLVAGVVWPSNISDQTVGSIAIWGTAECDVEATGVADQGLLCTGGTAGDGSSCEADNAAYAIANAAIAGAQGECFIK